MVGSLTVGLDFDVSIVVEFQKIFHNTALYCPDNAFTFVLLCPFLFIVASLVLISVDVNYNLTWWSWFILGNSYIVEDFVAQKFFCCWSIVMIEFKHLLQDFNKFCRGLWEPFFDRMISVGNTHDVFHVLDLWIIG